MVASNDRRCVNYRCGGMRLAALTATAVCGVSGPRWLARSACVVRFRPEEIRAVTELVSDQKQLVRSISNYRQCRHYLSTVTIGLIY